MDDPTPFYTQVIRLLKMQKIDFLIGGTFAVRLYTGIQRDTKDLDLFCKAGDYPRILNMLSKNGYEVDVEDERWIAKAYKNKAYVDLIFGSANAITSVDDTWFRDAPSRKLFGMYIKVIPPEFLIWSKAFVQDRYKYDGSDIAHMILKKHDKIDWKRLLLHMEMYWEVLLVHLLNFRFVYPTQRGIIPKWLLEELLDRLGQQDTVPVPHMNVCRGRLFSREDYAVDVRKWGFADIIGSEHDYGKKR